MQKQKFFSLLVFSLLFLFGGCVENAHAVSCHGTTEWGTNISGTCKRTCFMSPKEVSVVVPVDCNEGEFCCLANPNIGKSCSATIGGQSKSGACQIASDCSSATNDTGQDIAACKSDLVCCVPKSSGGGACKGVGGESGTCSATTSCAGSTKTDIDTANCGATNPCCIPNPSDGGGGGTGGGGTGGGGTGGGGAAVPCEQNPGMIKVGPTCISGNAGLSRMPISVIIVFLLKWLLYILGFLGAIAFVVSGVMYLTSAGDGTLIDRAKDYMIWSIVGVIVALGGLIIVQAINAWLQGSWYYF